MRIPLIVCVNKCDLQSQVFRDESNYKIMFVMYHLRSFCAKCNYSELINRWSKFSIHFNKK